MVFSFNRCRLTVVLDLDSITRPMIKGITPGNIGSTKPTNPMAISINPMMKVIERLTMAREETQFCLCNLFVQDPEAPDLRIPAIIDRDNDVHRLRIIGKLHIRC